MYGKEPHHQWYCPDIAKPIYQYSDSKTKPKEKLTWSDDTNPPDLSGIKIPSNSSDFQLGMELTYRDGEGKSVAVVYEGPSANSLTHTIRLEDRSKLQFHDSNLQLIDQPDLSNLPKLPWNIGMR